MKIRRFLPLLLLSILTAALLIAPAAALSEGDARVIIGANLDDAQITSVYKTFGIERGSVRELSVTIDEERDYLEGLVADSVLGTRSISCAYIEITAPGSGRQVSCSNISWCTEATYLNALVTAGIDDVRVLVTAPISVSGTAALTGIYKAYEDLTGAQLDDLAKIVGQHELVITSDIASQIGDIDAASIVNDLKMILDETQNMSDDELRAQIAVIAAEYNVTLTSGQTDQLIGLCRQFEGLSVDELKKKVEEVQGMIKNLATAQETLKNAGETAGRIAENVKNFFISVSDFFSNLFKK